MGEVAKEVVTSQEGSKAADPKSLDEKRHNRNYNPVDEAERGNVSAKLNVDAARYKVGPSIN